MSRGWRYAPTRERGDVAETPRGVESYPRPSRQRGAACKAHPARPCPSVPEAYTGPLSATPSSAATGPATAQPTPVAALVVSGMNDVLNSQGYTQAAWWNRVPAGAWLLMGFVAVACNFLLGYSEQHTTRTTLLYFPLIPTIRFVLIADIDSPRGGIIRVAPQNLIATARSISPH